MNFKNTINENTASILAANSVLLDKLTRTSLWGKKIMYLLVEILVMKR
jgi:hypothetical protein